jgi:hypothetical protein
MIRQFGAIAFSATALACAPARTTSAPQRAATSIAVVNGPSGGRQSVAVAALVRARLDSLTPPADLRIVTNGDYDSVLSGFDNFPSTQAQFHDLALLLRADVVVTISAQQHGSVTAARAVAHYPSAAGPDSLPIFKSSSDTLVADRIARFLVAETLRKVRRKLQDAAPARVVSAPGREYLLAITRVGSRASPLGDLRERAAGPNDVEVRAWGGYGMTGTGGVVLRREAGAWQAWLVKLEDCSLHVPTAEADTASAATLDAYDVLARERCDRPIADAAEYGRVFRAHRVEMSAVRAGADTMQRAWDAAVRAGLLTLPPDVKRTWEMRDGFTYVIEVRRGAEYRASVIEHVGTPEVPADAEVKRVFDAVTSVVPGARRRGGP